MRRGCRGFGSRGLCLLCRQWRRARMRRRWQRSRCLRRVANALGDLENVEKVHKELKGVEMGLLEVKHGLLQICRNFRLSS